LSPPRIRACAELPRRMKRGPPSARAAALDVRPPSVGETRVCRNSSTKPNRLTSRSLPAAGGPPVSDGTLTPTIPEWLEKGIGTRRAGIGARKDSCARDTPTGRSASSAFRLPNDKRPSRKREGRFLDPSQDRVTAGYPRRRRRPRLLPRMAAVSTIVTRTASQSGAMAPHSISIRRGSTPD
jgi:hypothetical protein